MSGNYSLALCFDVNCSSFSGADVRSSRVCTAFLQTTEPLWQVPLGRLI